LFRRIPTTAALIAFEAAARHESFSRAAEELGQTEGAVSRQITRLEDSLGVHLFTRLKQRVYLTELGRTYHQQVQQSLDRIERDTLTAMARQEQGGVLELAVIPTFTSKWLIPRLAGFQSAYPEITINMSDRADPFLFAGTPFDAALHFDHPAWAGTVKQELFAEELVPVCSPALLGGRSRLRPADLESLQLLHKTSRLDVWKTWCTRAGWPIVNPMRGPRYDLYALLVEAARAGLGIAIVPHLYVQSDIASGALATPLPHVPCGDKRYCLIYPESHESSWPLRLFVDWLLAEARLLYRGPDLRQPAALIQAAKDSSPILGLATRS